MLSKCIKQVNVRSIFHIYFWLWQYKLLDYRNLVKRPTGFLQCFDTVGLVVWPVKIIPEMTYNVSSGMLSLYTTTLHYYHEAV